MPSRYIAWPWRYTSCLRCHKVFKTSRLDRLTCSGACRTWVHRHPGYKEEWETRAFDAGVPLHQLLFVRALLIRRPELSEEAAARTMAERNPLLIVVDLQRALREAVAQGRAGGQPRSAWSTASQPDEQPDEPSDEEHRVQWQEFLDDLEREEQES